MHVRAAQHADLEAITDITNALLGSTTYEWTETPHTAAERGQWLEAKEAAGWPVLVAVEDDAVVGWASYGDFRDSRRWPGYRFTVEHSVHVAEAAWGRGTGRALMASLLDHARRGGRRVMVAAIDGSNEPSVVFHRRLGFVEVGHLPGIGEKWGQRLDLVLMQRNLDER